MSIYEEHPKEQLEEPALEAMCQHVNFHQMIDAIIYVMQELGYTEERAKIVGVGAVAAPMEPIIRAILEKQRAAGKHGAAPISH